MNRYVMTGFKDAFAVNFDLPDLIGLGKPALSCVEGAVSRACPPKPWPACASTADRRRQGFGTVRRVSARTD